MVILIAIIGLFWAFFAFIGHMNSLREKSGCKMATRWAQITTHDRLGLLFAALIYGGGLGALSSNKFQLTNFCLMNKKDSYCQSTKTDCFDKYRRRF